jgi:hypothetical protein
MAKTDKPAKPAKPAKIDKATKAVKVKKTDKAPDTTNISVVPIAPQGKVCKPFLLEVMVFSPESGFKFKVIVERSCTPTADPVWKLVFDLYKIVDDKEVQIVHVSYTAGTPVESQAVATMAREGVKPDQATVLVQEVHPAARAVAGKTTPPTDEQKAALHGAMADVLKIEF